MKRFFYCFISFLLLFGYFLTFPSSSLAECKIPGDKCQDFTPCCSPVAGKLYSCQGTNDIGSGGDGTCKEAAPVPCTCDHPGVAKSGQNGFHCTDPATKETKLSYCQTPEFACVNDTNSTLARNDVFPGKILKGITCVFNEAKPPAPPCAPGALKNGKCTAVVTAFGNLQTDPGGFITRLFGILLAAAGGIALLLIMRAGYRIMSARGNPEGIKEGREQLIAAIVGLMFLIFSFVLLQVIGVDLLRIPNFAGGGTTTSGSCSDKGGSCLPSSDSYCTFSGTNLGKLGCGTGLTCCKGKTCVQQGGRCMPESSCLGKSLGRQDCGTTSTSICCK